MSDYAAIYDRLMDEVYQKLDALRPAIERREVEPVQAHVGHVEQAQRILRLMDELLTFIG